MERVRSLQEEFDVVTVGFYIWTATDMHGHAALRSDGGAVGLLYKKLDQTWNVAGYTADQQDGSSFLSFARSNAACPP